MNDIREKLEGILDTFGVDFQSSLKDQFDSLDFISFVLELEEVFEVELPDNLLDINSIQSVDHVVEVIESLIIKSAR